MGNSLPCIQTLLLFIKNLTSVFGNIFCGANQLLFLVYHKVIYGIFCLKISSLRGRGWLFIYLLLLLLTERAPSHPENFSLLPKRGRQRQPGNFDVDYRLLDTVNVLLLSLYIYLIVISLGSSCCITLIASSQS